jgi:hypothetical protein
MHHFIRFVRLGVGPILLTLMLLLLAGCATNKPAAACGGATADKSASATTATPAITPTTAPPAVNIAPAAKAIRIRAGTTLPLTDSTGNVWQPDDGFADGETVERPDLAIANTKDPGLYQAERYSMTSFSWPLPNGKYTVKLHFAETYEGVSAARTNLINDNWRFIKGDPTNINSKSLLYDVRPVARGDDQRERLAEATEDAEKLVAATNRVLKPWILPTGNRFLKDPAKRHVVRREIPGGDVAYVQNNFDDSWLAAGEPAA